MANIIRTPWEDKFCLAIQTASFNSPAYFNSSDYAGMSGSGEFGLLLNSRPSFDAGLSRDFTDKTTGLAENRHDAGNVYEYTDGRKSPVVSLDMGLTPNRIKMLTWLLCQQGCSESTNQLTGVVPVRGYSAPEVWASIGRSMGVGTAADQFAMHGCIATQMTISGAAGERYNLVAEMAGRSLVTNYNHQSTDYTIETIGENMFFDFTYSLGGVDISNYFESFELTINNNAAPRHQGSQDPSRFILQKFTSSGTAKISMSADTGTGDNTQFDAFIAGTLKKIIVSTGTAASPDYIKMEVISLYTGAEVDPAEELMLNLPFDAVYGGAGSPSFQIDADSGVSNGIPA